MNLKCALGFHRWEGCRCARCGAVQHAWEYCRCTVCGEHRPSNHLIDESTCKCRFCDTCDHSYSQFKCLMPDKASFVAMWRLPWDKPSHELDAQVEAEIARLGGLHESVSEDLGPFVCSRCGRPAPIDGIATYVWEVVLFGRFAKALSLGNYAHYRRGRPQHLADDFQPFHMALCSHLTRVVEQVLVAAQEAAARHPPALGLRSLSEACRMAFSRTQDRVEHKLGANKAKRAVEQFLIRPWGDGRRASADELLIFAKNLGGGIEPEGVPRHMALEILWRAKKQYPKSQLLAEVIVSMHHVAGYDDFNVGMRLGRVLHLCVPSGLPKSSPQGSNAVASR